MLRRCLALTAAAAAVGATASTAPAPPMAAAPGAPAETPPATPVYVINLERSVERWSSIAGQLAAHGIDAQRIDAVDGRLIAAEALPAVATQAAIRMLPRGVIGCALSHRRFWETLVERGHEHAVVLEDDAVLEPGFAEAVEQCLSELPPDWDVCLLGAIGCSHPHRRHGALNSLFSAYTGGARRVRSIGEHVYVPHRPGGTHAYLCSKRGAAKLLARLPRAKFHVDLVAWHASVGLDLYASHPFLAHQDCGAASTLSDGGGGDGAAAAAAAAHDEADWRLSVPLGGGRALRLCWPPPFVVDAHTRQTWSHAFHEPLFYLPGRVLLTVGRHQMALVLSALAAEALRRSKHGLAAKVRQALLGAVSLLVVTTWLTVRTLVYTKVPAAAAAPGL